MADVALRELTEGDEAAFLNAVAEFEATDPDWEFAFHFDEAARADFRGYVGRLRRWSRGADLPAGWVPNTFLVGAAGDRIAGRLSLRHQLDDFLREVGGHVGFGVVASCRRRGYATAMLRQSFPLARDLGIDRLLVTCDETNLASRAVIERCGGILEDTRPRDDGITRRYWIAL
jgi:predicted acetyltransferase